MSVGTKMQATFMNHSTHRETTIDLRGDFWGGSGDLTVEGGPTVAQITRQMMNMREMFTDNQTVSFRKMARGYWSLIVSTLSR